MGGSLLEDEAVSVGFMWMIQEKGLTRGIWCTQEVMSKIMNP